MGDKTGTIFFAVNGIASPKEIIRYLEDYANVTGFRTLREILNSVCPVPDLQAHLIERMQEMEKELPPQEAISPDGVSRNVRNWLTGRTNVSRKNLFKICFALRLTPEQASSVLASASDTGIHYRNPEELIYAFSLRKKLSWGEALALKERMKKALETDCPTLFGGPDVSGAERTKRKRSQDEQRRKQAGELLQANPAGTQVLLQSWLEVNTEQELEAFLRENAPQLGELHITAHRDFLRMLDYLQNPDKDTCSYFEWLEELYKQEDYRDSDSYITDGGRDGTKKPDVADGAQDGTEETYRGRKPYVEAGKKSAKGYSLSKVVEEYLKMRVPDNSPRNGRGGAARQQRDYSYLQRVIMKQWPVSDEIIQNMVSGVTDVSRKALLLLFLLTDEFEMAPPDGDASEDEYFILELDDLTPGERMEERMIQIDDFLIKYGMNPLDPRNPFDILVLYALKAIDDMSEPMREVMETLFASALTEELTCGASEG